MRVAIRYYSRTGGTRQLAFAIQEELGVVAEPIDIPIPYGVELLFLGTATYNGRTAGEIADYIMTLKERNIRVVSFSSSVFKKSNYQFLKKQLSAAKITLLPENFHSGSLFYFFNRKQPSEDDKREIKKFSKDVVGKYIN